MCFLLPAHDLDHDIDSKNYFQLRYHVVFPILILNLLGK